VLSGITYRLAPGATNAPRHAVQLTLNTTWRPLNAHKLAKGCAQWSNPPLNSLEKNAPKTVEDTMLNATKMALNVASIDSKSILCF